MSESKKVDLFFLISYLKVFSIFYIFLSFFSFSLYLLFWNLEGIRWHDSGVTTATQIKKITFIVTTSYNAIEE